MGTKYKRVLLKISGEALLGNQQFGIDYEPVEMIANDLTFSDRNVLSPSIKFGSLMVSGK